MVHHLKVLVTNPLLNVPLGPREVVVSNKHLRDSMSNEVNEYVTGPTTTWKIQV